MPQNKIYVNRVTCPCGGNVEIINYDPEKQKYHLKCDSCNNNIVWKEDCLPDAIVGFARKYGYIKK